MKIWFHQTKKRDGFWGRQAVLILVPTLVLAQLNIGAQYNDVMSCIYTYIYIHIYVYTETTER